MLSNHNLPALLDHGEVPAQIVFQFPDANRIDGHIHGSIIATTSGL
jgi:hypothetical protein